MSFESVAWALPQPVSGTKKVLLIGIASHADKYGDNAWPSIPTLAEYACVSERNVQHALNALVDEGYVFRDLNEGGSRRVAGHMRPNLYRLNMLGKPVVSVADKPLSPASPGVGSDTPPVSPASPPPVSVATPPPVSPATPESSMEPSIEPSSKKKGACAPTLPGVPDGVLQDFLKIRAAKKAPLTETAVRGLQREADKAELTLTQAIEVCCELGWLAFNAEWYAQRQAKTAVTQGGGAAVGQRAETPYQRSMRERVAEFSPSVARRAPGPIFHTLEAEYAAVRRID